MSNGINAAEVCCYFTAVRYINDVSLAAQDTKCENDVIGCDDDNEFAK